MMNMKKLLSLMTAAAMSLSLAAAEDADILSAPDGEQVVQAQTMVGLDGTITLTYDANITTGYSWSAFVLAGSCVEIDEEASGYVSDANPGMLDGVGGTYYFVLNAVEPGEGIIRLRYARGLDEVANEVVLYVAVDESLAVYVQDVTAAGAYDGVVTEAYEDSRTVLLYTDRAGDVIATIPDDMAMPVAGEHIMIYTNGAMTMSLPPMVNVMAWESLPDGNAREQLAAEAVGMVNPWKAVESVEELNVALGMNLCLPAVMGVTDVKCSLLLDGVQVMGQVYFDLNGRTFLLRGSPDVSAVISGIWLDDGTTAFASAPDDAVATVFTEDVMAARWVHADGQYVLYADPSELDEVTFDGMVQEMITLTDGNM